MLTIENEISQDDRRARVRELADITTVKYTNEKLDKKILNGDEVAMAYFPDRTTFNTRLIITISNLTTAILIRSGFKSENNKDAIDNMKAMVKKIVEIANNKAEEQGPFQMEVSSGMHNDGIFSSRDDTDDSN